MAMALSQNGWPANDRSLVSKRPVPGTSIGLIVRNGPAGDLLLWTAGEFNRRVEPIVGGQTDDWGYAERPIRGGVELSNHASGTAIDLNATQHPLAASGTFTTPQVAEIHKILAETGNVVRWGGDYDGRKDEMHFEINASEQAVAAAWQRIQDSEQEDDMWYHNEKIPAGFAYDNTGKLINPEALVTVTVPPNVNLSQGGSLIIAGDGLPGTKTLIRRAYNIKDEEWDVEDGKALLSIEPKYRAASGTKWFSKNYGKVSFGRVAFDELDKAGGPLTDRDRVAETAAVSYVISGR